MYYRASTLAEAIERAAHHGSIALAGGALALSGLNLPFDTVIDLQDLLDLKRIEHDEHGLHIGGINTLQEVVESPLVADKLKQAITRTVPLNIRNGASVGESLMVKQPPSEWLAALVALDANIEHAGHLAEVEKSPLWEQSLEEFVPFLHLHGHPYQGIITQVRIPPMGRHTAIGSAVVSRTPTDIPIINAAVRVTLDHGGLVKSAVAAIGGASELPVLRVELLPLLGHPIDDGNIQHAVEIVDSQVHPISDYLGSSDYRRQMVAVCIRRALNECVDQFKSSQFL
jgi:carbon-monoxide dehydrogenase medium subunit